MVVRQKAVFYNVSVKHGKSCYDSLARVPSGGVRTGALGRETPGPATPESETLRLSHRRVLPFQSPSGSARLCRVLAPAWATVARVAAVPLFPSWSAHVCVHCAFQDEGVSPPVARPLPVLVLFLNDEHGIEVRHAQDLLQASLGTRRGTAPPVHQLGKVSLGNTAAAGQFLLGNIELVQQFPHGDGVELHPDLAAPGSHRACPLPTGSAISSTRNSLSWVGGWPGGRRICGSLLPSSVFGRPVALPLPGNLPSGHGPTGPARER